MVGKRPSMEVLERRVELAEARLRAYRDLHDLPELSDSRHQRWSEDYESVRREESRLIRACADAQAEYDVAVDDTLATLRERVRETRTALREYEAEHERPELPPLDATWQEREFYRHEYAPFARLDDAYVSAQVDYDVATGVLDVDVDPGTTTVNGRARPRTGRERREARIAVARSRLRSLGDAAHE
jgi:hypothetical protein